MTMLEDAIISWLNSNNKTSHNIRSKIALGLYRLSLTIDLNNDKDNKNKYKVSIKDVSIDAHAHYLDHVLHRLHNNGNNDNYVCTNKIVIVNFIYNNNNNNGGIKRNVYDVFKDIGDYDNGVINWMNEKLDFIVSKEPSTGIAYYYKLPQTPNNINNCNNNRIHFGTLQLPSVLLPVSEKKAKEQMEKDEKTELPQSAHDLRQMVADFQSLPSISSAATRAALLISSTCHGYRWKVSDRSTCIHDDDDDDTINVIIEKDIKDSIGNDTTDGSGFISADLAQRLPSAVSQGKMTLKSCNNTAASCYQCRVFCKQGLFKGTLLTNSSLKKTIILRESMRKVMGIDSERKGFVDVEIVNTSTNPKTCSNLNKHLILILSHCGVSYQTFFDLVEARVMLLRTLSSFCSDRRIIGDIQLLLDSIKLLPTSKDKLTIESMITEGQNYLDPFIQISLRRLIDREASELVSFSIPVSNTFFIVGIPDPTGTLKVGEVFIYDGGSDGDEHDPGLLSSSLPPQSRVFVTRFPLLSTESISLFTTVKNDALHSFFHNTKMRLSGSLLVFPSCDLTTSPVINMGGDYDGDLYFISGNITLVNQLAAYSNNSSSNNQDGDAYRYSGRPALDDDRPLVVMPKPPSRSTLILNMNTRNKSNSISKISNINASIDNDDTNGSKVNSSINFKFKTISSPPSTTNAKIIKPNSLSQITKDTFSTTSPSCVIESHGFAAFQRLLFFEFLHYYHNKVKVGKLSNDWFTVASVLGPNSKLARVQAEYFRSCMNERKGKKRTDADADSSKGISAFRVNDYDDNSVVKRLSTVFSLHLFKQELTIPWTPITVNLDADLRHDRAQEFLEQALTLHSQFCKDFSKIVKDELEPSTTTTTTSSSSKENIKKVMMFSLSSSSLIESYRCFFEEMVDHLWNLDVNLNSNDDHGKDNNIDSIRKGLASAMYEVAYSEAANIYKTYGFNSSSNSSILKMLRVPWTIVTKELNEIKQDKKLARELENMKL